MSSRGKKVKVFQELYPHELPPRLCNEPLAELTALQDPHLHFTTFKNSIFVQILTLVKLLGWMPGIEIISDLSKSKFKMETVEPINERTAKFYNVHNNASHAAKIMDEKELFLLKLTPLQAFQWIFCAQAINCPYKNIFSKIVQAIYCPP